ncbi:MAG: cbb3-type cytochrome c oxidase subunit I, partial [Planctomycetes bacterium]|nr:cbb3-type cytochrome c oxidase subunit I [Planctomycetota bacterium]
MAENPTETIAPAPDYIRASRGVLSWLTTTDHKRIGVLYLVLIAVFFLFGVTMAFLMRLELLHAGEQILSSNAYNRILTLHGITMIFLFIIPGIPAVFGNFLLPIMIGANDVSFPRLNLASWYCYLTGGLFALISVGFGGPDTGWTFYVPYSRSTEANVFFPVVAAFILGWSSILTGLNFIVTVHRLRAPGMRWG